MKAWRLDRLGGNLTFEDVPIPEVRPGSVLVRIAALPLLSYFKAYVEGKLTTYSPPPGKFTPGTGGVGVIDAVGRDVWHLKPGQRVVFSPHLVARENVEDPAQLLIGLTAFGGGSAALQADWRDGALAEFALAPVTAITPAEGLDALDGAALAPLNRFIVPFGGLLRGRLAAGETLVVNGATGAYGTAAVLLGVAMGAARVIAGAQPGGARPGGGGRRDTGGAGAACRRRAGGCGGAARGVWRRRAHRLRHGRAGGQRQCHAGGAAEPAPRRQARPHGQHDGAVDALLRRDHGEDWEIIGQFMYPAAAYQRLLGLLRAGMLDISAVRPRRFALKDLPQAMAAAAGAGNLECVVVEP